MASDKKNAKPEETQKQTTSGDALAKGEEIVKTALNEAQDVAKAQNGNAVGDGASNDEVTDKFKGLPMRDLIGAPLLAAAEAQQNLASVAWDFYQKIAFEKAGDPKARTLDFTINRPVEQDGTLEMVSQKIQAPFIGLVPVPSLLIDRININFQMEVTDTNVNKSSSESEASTKISGGWWVTKAEVSGKVSSSKENTRTTNQTAKYQVQVTASQQPQTEGLSKLMDIMASCIDPVETK